MLNPICYSHCTASLRDTQLVVAIGLLLFVLLKQHLDSRQFHNVKEGAMAVREWLRVQPPNSYGDNNF
jgi:hypothetical protein